MGVIGWDRAGERWAPSRFSYALLLLCIWFGADIVLWFKPRICEKFKISDIQSDKGFLDNECETVWIQAHSFSWRKKVSETIPKCRVGRQVSHSWHNMWISSYAVNWKSGSLSWILLHPRGNCRDNIFKTTDKISGLQVFR